MHSELKKFLVLGGVILLISGGLLAWRFGWVPQIGKFFASDPNSPLVVGPSSRVVVMEYEAWFNPLFNPQLFSTAAYRPLLTSSTVTEGYDSSDPAVINQHVAWLTELGVDAVIAEQTNGGPCDFGDLLMCRQFMESLGTLAQYAEEYTATIHAINQGAMNLYPAFSSRATNIKLIPMVDGQDLLMYQPRGDGQIPFNVQIDGYYQKVLQYPNLSVIYQGKPLLLVYLGAAQNPGDPNSVLNNALAATQAWQDRFTVRLMAGFIESQPYLWSSTSGGIAGLHEINPAYKLWTWIDRLNPAYGLLASYAVDGGRVEAFTVTSAAVSTDAVAWWNGADTTLYRNGATYTDFFNYARQLDPIFLIVNQFNEFSGPPDQGADIEHSNDIEPTQQWGHARFNVVKQKLCEYRGEETRCSPPPSPAPDLTALGSNDGATYTALPTEGGGIIAANSVFGWAFDPDALTQAVAVHLYFDGEPGTCPDATCVVRPVTADTIRGDVNRVFGITGNHGFTYDLTQLPARFLDGQNHTVSAYAINIPPQGQAGTASNAPLGTKTFNLVAPTPTPTPTPTSSPVSVLGDASGDGHVNILDFGIVVSHFGQTGGETLGDVNFDGAVNILDFGIVVSHFGQ